MSRPIGEKQANVLRCLIEHGGWERNCGWIWDTHSNTERILGTLVKRGLAVKLKGGAYRHTAAGQKEHESQQAMKFCVRLFG